MVAQYEYIIGRSGAGVVLNIKKDRASNGVRKNVPRMVRSWRVSGKKMMGGRLVCLIVDCWIGALSLSSAS